MTLKNLVFDKGGGALFSVAFRGQEVRCHVEQANAFFWNKASPGQSFADVFERYATVVAFAAAINIARDGISAHPWGNLITPADLEAAQEQQLLPRFEDFRRQANALRDSLEASKPRPDSLEAYLLNHLRTLTENVNRSASFKEVARSTDALGRFCIESMDHDDALFRQCQSLIAMTKGAENGS